MTEFIRLLDGIKGRAGTTALPIAETTAEAFARMGVPGAKAPLSRGFYLDLCRNTGFVVGRWPHHGLLRWGRHLFLLWLVCDEGGGASYWGTRLTNVETDAVVRLRGIRDVRVPGSCCATDDGTPLLPVGKLKPGTRFVALDGRPGVVTRVPTARLVEVVMTPDTARATRQRWPAEVRVLVARPRLAEPTTKG